MLQDFGDAALNLKTHRQYTDGCKTSCARGLANATRWMRRAPGVGRRGDRRTAKAVNLGRTQYHVAYGYDLAGRPLSALYDMVAGAPGVTWAFDAAGRRIQEATNGLAMSFTWDKAGNPRTTTWPDSRGVTFVYDGANRFVSVGNIGGTVSAGYDTLSRVNELTRPSSSTTIGHDNADRINSLAHTFTTGAETWTFAFTGAGQLTSAASTNAAWDWQPAPAAAVATAPNGLNQNASVGGAAWVYDKNGNLTSDGVRTFSYDPENRLLTESGPVAMTLSYDPTGRLQQSVIGSTTTQFLYDGDALAAEYNGSGTMLRRYVHGPQIDNPLIWFEGSTMGTTNSHYLIPDRQGTITGVANNAGAVGTPYAYSAYGDPDRWGVIGTDPRFRYTGQIAIPEAQLYYFKARMLDPGGGKFLQTDPVGDKDDLNRYAYVREDPANRSDPTGLVGPQQGDALSPQERVDLDSATMEGVSKGLDFLADVSLGLPGGPGDAAALSELSALADAAADVRLVAADESASETGAGVAISEQKQAGHIEGTPQHTNRVNQGRPTSTFQNKKQANALTRDTHATGRRVPGRTGVKQKEYGHPVGRGPRGGTQSAVRVHEDADGKIHGHPCGPETKC